MADPTNTKVWAAYNAYMQARYLLVGEEDCAEMPEREFHEAALSIAKTACIMQSLRDISDHLEELADQVCRIGNQLESASSISQSF
jgi:hypothetical protein